MIETNFDINLQHHLGPVRHQVGDPGAGSTGEGDQQSRGARGGDGVIEKKPVPPDPDLDPDPDPEME